QNPPQNLHSFPTRRSSDLTGTELDGTPYVFTPLQSGNVIVTDIPARVRYPITEATTNIGSLAEAVQNMGGSDEIDVKLWWDVNRSEEHTSELQSRENLVCR